jgi:hypothetical protein
MLIAVAVPKLQHRRKPRSAYARSSDEIAAVVQCRDGRGAHAGSCDCQRLAEPGCINADLP